MKLEFVFTYTWIVGTVCVSEEREGKDSTCPIGLYARQTQSSLVDFLVLMH